MIGMEGSGLARPLVLPNPGSDDRLINRLKRAVRRRSGDCVPVNLLYNGKK